MTTSLFTWGYYGWGNATPQLIEAVDAVEQSRGFEPLVFVDIRIRRTVRATGFQGNAFEKLLGPSRHRWMKSLGNKFIQTRIGPNVQIADPSAADELLSLALDASQQRQRVLLFCGCQWPRLDGKIACHRTTVAGLVLEAAKKRGESIEIVEWPGGEPMQIDVEVTPKVFAAVRKAADRLGQTTVPMGSNVDLAEIGGLPWFSVATLHSNGEKLRRFVGPAVWKKNGWALPVPLSSYEPAAVQTDWKKDAQYFRQKLGFEPASG